MENLMIKAIRQFKREHKGCEIRKISAFEADFKGKKCVNALFGITYTEKKWDNLKECEIFVTRESK